MNDCCVMPSEQLFSYITENILIEVKMKISDSIVLDQNAELDF
jgi:hypothetical protein